jgi:COX assembly mitochondrial protein 1
MVLITFCHRKMSFYDKSSKQGYDGLDTELNEELEEMLLRTPPKIQRHMQHRIHDAILLRMKEESTKRCIEFIKKFEKCVNSFAPHKQTACFPHRDAMNDCVHEVNSEQNYQKWRLMYLRGELLKLHEARTLMKVEQFKRNAPDSIPTFKADYAPKYADLMEDYGLAPTGNIKMDDLAGLTNIGVGKLERPQ